ncbi:MAG: hypothetical protein JW934_23380 [Anaerolineae bacterium]|nr:hypothetical protein [Anaerolineae bacterium]
MFSKQELKELAAYTSETWPVLSVYLNVDATQVTTEQYRLALKGMLKSIAEQADAADVNAVEKYVNLEYDRHSKGLLIFSCAAQDLWRVYGLAVPVKNEVYVSPRPYVKQMADLLDAYDRYAVVMVDREGGRVYLFYLGALQDVTGTFGEELRESIHDAAGRGGRAGTGSKGDWTANLQNRLDQVINRNLREVVDLTQQIFKSGRCERIIVAGTDENRARFLNLLPKDLQNKVAGGFAVDMSASVLDVMERSLEVVNKSVAERKANLVKSIITAAHKEVGSIGLADTLLAVQEQRVQTLAICERFSAPGYICDHCEYITIKKVTECPICNGGAHEVQDVVDTMVHLAIANDVEIAFVQSDELADLGSIGALWRF